MGREQTLPYIHSRFWIPASCGLICSVTKHCLYCKRRKATSGTPFMANLPTDRLCFNNKPFTKTGVDYLRLYQIKSSKFTYEIQSSNRKTLHSFIHMLINKRSPSRNCWRFVHRFLHSFPETILSKKVKIKRSENRTNFVGASAELKQGIKALKQTFMNKHLVAKN